jgi:hypothetical protein
MGQLGVSSQGKKSCPPVSGKSIPYAPYGRRVYGFLIRTVKNEFSLRVKSYFAHKECTSKCYEVNESGFQIFTQLLHSLQPGQKISPARRESLAYHVHLPRAKIPGTQKGPHITRQNTPLAAQKQTCLTCLQPGLMHRQCLLPAVEKQKVPEIITHIGMQAAWINAVWTCCGAEVIHDRIECPEVVCYGISQGSKQCAALVKQLHMVIQCRLRFPPGGCIAPEDICCHY